MDQVFSTRLDKDLIKKMNRFIQEKSITKKSFVEKAIRSLLNRKPNEEELDIIDRSFGAWKRYESASETWAKGRKTITGGLDRHRVLQNNRK